MSGKRGAPCLAGSRDSVFCGWCELVNHGCLSSIQDTQGTREGYAEVCAFGSVLQGLAVWRGSWDRGPVLPKADGGREAFQGVLARS